MTQSDQLIGSTNDCISGAFEILTRVVIRGSPPTAFSGIALYLVEACWISVIVDGMLGGELPYVSQ